MGVLDGVVIVEGKGPVLGVNLGRPVVTNGTATRSSQITLGGLVTFGTAWRVPMEWVLTRSCPFFAHPAKIDHPLVILLYIAYAAGCRVPRNKG